MNLNYYFLSHILASFLILIFSLFVFKKDKKAEVNRSFFIFSSTIFIWLLFSALGIISVRNAQILLYYKLSYVGIILIPPTFFYFISCFLRKKSNFVIIVNFVISTIFIFFLWFSEWLIKGIYEYSWGYYPRASIILHPVFLLFFNILFIDRLISLFLKMHEVKNTLTPMEKARIKYVLLGGLLGIGGAIDFLPNYGIGIFPFGFIFMVIFLIIFSYAILKYQLMDIRLAITRAGIFAFVYVFVLGIPFWLGYATKSWPLSTTLAVFLATLGPFIFQYLCRRAENVILKEQRRYQEVLRQLSATLTLIKDLERLLKLVVLRVARAVKVDFACVYLANENKLIQKYPYTIKGFFPDFPKELSFNSNLIRYITAKRKPVFAEEISALTDGFNLKTGLIVPSFVRKRLLGFLVLGPKASGVIYTQEDANIFGILANQLALAIENSQFIDEHERTQAELFARERMASLGTMAGGMTHQINNRFHAIALAATDALDNFQFMDISPLNQEAKDYLGQIKYSLERVTENAEHGGKIVNDFLNFSQPERLQKEAKEFDLRQPLERAIEMFKIKTAFPEGRIVIEIPEGSYFIRGDFVLMQDALFNFINNGNDAIIKIEQAMEKKELSVIPNYQGKIIIRMYKTGSELITEIEDNGIGMNEDTQKRIFVPFFTMKATSVKGTGLGLFVIEKIIQAHNGTIDVKSTYGKGTKFTIRLPLNQKGER